MVKPTTPDAALWTPPGPATALQDDALAALAAVPLVEGLGNREQRKLLGLMHQRRFTAGEVVFRAGDRGAGMYVVQSGGVSIVSTAEDGTETVLAHLTERHFFGELSLLDSGPRSAAAVATVPTLLLGLFQPDLENLVERDARLGARLLWNLGRVLARRLRAQSQGLLAAADPTRSGASRALESA